MCLILPGEQYGLTSAWSECSNIVVKNKEYLAMQ